MKNTLYIIGNGFDLHHKQPTSYNNFRNNYAKKSPILWNYLEKIYGLDRILNDMWWANFEEMLGEVNYTSLLHSNNGIALGDQKAKDFIRNLSLFLGNWIKNIDERIHSDKLILRQDIIPNALFFTFNYTTLLEKVYKVHNDNIWHIHGSILDFKENQKSLIVGHDSDGAKLIQYSSNYHDQDISPAYKDSINQAIMKGAKRVKERITQNEEKFKHYSTVTHFIVMGFSFNDIDMPYIKKIIDVNHDIYNTKWTIYWHTEGEDTAIIEKLQHLKIKKEQITTKYW
jgi:hypothetical protein